MKLEKRIKRIVSLTVEDWYNSGYSTDQSTEELKAWLCDELMQDQNIEDAHTYEISIKVLDILKSLEIVDLEFIHETLLKRDESTQVTISFVFDEVVV
jgi:Asp-tRNA(Asn)/Glu-tRNA(Gln) amidotransferase B subunit